MFKTSRLILACAALVLAAVSFIPKESHSRQIYVEDNHDYSAFVGSWFVIWNRNDGPPVYGEVIINETFGMASVFFEAESDPGSRSSSITSARMEDGQLFALISGRTKARRITAWVRVGIVEGGNSLSGPAFYGSESYGSVVFNRMIPNVDPKVCCAVYEDQGSLVEEGKIKRGGVGFWVDLKPKSAGLHSGLPERVWTWEAPMHVVVDRTGLSVIGTERKGGWGDWRVAFWASPHARSGPVAFTVNGQRLSFELDINTVCHSQAATIEAAESFCEQELQCESIKNEPPELKAQCDRGGAAWKCSCG